MADEKDMREQIQQMLRNEQARKIRDYKTLNKLARKGGIVFTGSSLMEMFPICELAASAGIFTPIYNRGVSGTTSDDFLREIDTVLLDLQPSKVFLNIGTNDMTESIYGKRWMEHLMANYEEILRIATEVLPNVEIFVMAYYPANLHFPDQTEQQRELLKLRTKENLAVCNHALNELSQQYGQHYIDVNAGLTDQNGEQKLEYSIDGVHMYAEAYAVVFENLRKYLGGV